MDDDEPVQETNSAAHVRMGSTLPARFELLSSLSDTFLCLFWGRSCLQCFDAVGWVPRRACSQQKFCDEALQGFVFNATARGAGFHNVPVPLPWPFQNPIAFWLIKAQNGFTFMVLAYLGFPRKISLNRCLFVLKLYCYNSLTVSPV